MILETIFLWVGGTLCISGLLCGLILLLFYIFDRLWFNTIISIKAIYFHLVSEVLAKQGHKARDGCELKLGVKHSTFFRGKRYMWKCIEVKDREKKK